MLIISDVPTIALDLRRNLFCIKKFVTFTLMGLLCLFLKFVGDNCKAQRMQ